MVKFFKKNKITKLLALALAMMMATACLSVTSFAAAPGTATINAISGSGQVSTSLTSGYVSTLIYSGSSSWFGHADIVVTGGDALVQIIKPDGAGQLYEGGMQWLSPGTHHAVMTNCPAGNYELRVQSLYGDYVTVVATLGDWW